MDDKDLKRMMAGRSVPPMRSHLTERIVEASLHHEQQGRSSLNLWMRAFMDAIILPQPAYVMAGLLIFALLGGYAVDAIMQYDVDLSASDYIYLALDVQEGDWL